MCSRAKNILALCTESYALSTSNWRKYACYLVCRAISTTGNTVANAVMQFRPLQNPCWSRENNEEVNSPRRITNIFMINRYQTLLTEIGLRLAGEEVVRPGLGMALISVSSNSGVHPDCSMSFRHVHRIPAN